jgi:endoglycosylceramidase
VQRAFTHLYEDADIQDAQTRLWAMPAGRFGRHPALLGYDPLNEPMGELHDGEDLPTAARRVEAEQITPMYHRVAAAIRAHDRRHWIFVEPTPIVGEGVPTGLGRIRAEKVVHAPHFYSTAMEAGAAYDPDAGWIEAYEAAVTAYPAQQRIPVVVGEWGPPDSRLPGMDRFYDDAVTSMARYGSGWAGYVWCYGGGYCALDGDGRFLPRKERTATPYAAAVAGTVQEDAYTPQTRTHRLRYRATGPAGTELSLPPADTGWRVTVTGKGARASSAVVEPGRAAEVRVSAAHGAAVSVTVVPGS